MGCDGGTIPKRDELVRTKKKPEKKDKQSELSFKWGHCSITQEPLQTPIVACQLGRLFSKVAVIEALLNPGTMPETYNYIKSIKDVKELNLTDNPAFKNCATKGDSYNDNVSPYICPVIGLEMNGKYKFIYYWSCGCVLSERAFKAVKSQLCHKCQKPIKEEDVIILNGTDEDIEDMKKKMQDRKIQMKAAKKEQKNNKKIEKEQDVSAQKDSCNTMKNVENGCKNVNNGAHSSQTLKLGVKRSNKVIEIEDPDFKKTKLNYSVAKDPKATEVFKSLFTSHKNAKTQEKAHWITYNPFYN